jgi:hypothetical protein
MVVWITGGVSYGEAYRGWGQAIVIPIINLIAGFGLQETFEFTP